MFASDKMKEGSPLATKDSYGEFNGTSIYKSQLGKGLQQEGELCEIEWENWLDQDPTFCHLILVFF